jgi:transcriptional regulator with XRE-family HTH domain
MTLVFGHTARGRLDTRAAAEDLGVSRRTVQRWLHGAADEPPAIPAARLAQIIELSRPDPEVLEQERRDAQYAREAIRSVALPRGRGILPAWRERQWIEPHLVAVVEVPRTGLGLRQVAVTRVAGRALQDLHRRGQVLDFTTVETRFHATALAHELLRMLDPWRVQPPASLVKQAPTRTWVADAPTVDLSHLAVTHGLR